MEVATAPEISSRLQWTQTQDKGDLMLPVPALRVKGRKADELAREWAEKVWGLAVVMIAIAVVIAIVVMDR